MYQIPVTAGQLRIEVPELEEMLSLLSGLFNIRTAFLYSTGEEQITRELAGRSGEFRPFCQAIQSAWKDRCAACDRDKFAEAAARHEPLLYRCYNGLYEMYLPLFVDEVLVGYLHFGQVRSEDSFEEIRQACGLDRHPRCVELEEHYRKMEVVPREKLQLICRLFAQMADHILKNKLIEVKQVRPEYFLKKYIQENLQRQVTVEDAARYIGRSKSFVTHKFREAYGMSFSAYVRQYRIEQSKQHLRTAGIDRAWSLCGFKNRYQFSREFKRVTGLSPGQYRQQHA